VNQSLLSNYLVIRYTRKLQDIVLKITFISIFQLEKKRKHGFKLLDVKTNFGGHANTVGKILLHRTNRNAYYVN
jgi:hypothetical protein